MSNKQIYNRSKAAELNDVNSLFTNWVVSLSLSFSISKVQIRVPTLFILWLPRWLSGKESTCNAGDARNVGAIPGSGRSPGGGNGNPFQYFS